MPLPLMRNKTNKNRKIATSCCNFCYVSRVSNVFGQITWIEVEKQKLEEKKNVKECEQEEEKCREKVKLTKKEVG